VTTGAHSGQVPGLRCFFQPRSVALVGASEREGSVGRALLENLATFPGALHLVHPRHSRVLGKPAVPSLSALGHAVDLVVIATPAAGVPELVEEAGRCGIGAAVVISAGFRETGAAGAALEARVRTAAQQGGVRILGPNCLGVMAPHGGLNATFAKGCARPGRVAFLSQSGALCTAILDWSAQKNLGFSAFVSVGSMLDVAWGDLIRHFGEDPHTDSLVLYMESVGDADAFLRAAREVTPRKPVVVIKVGRTAAAARAAASHTGAMTGCDAVLDAAFEQCGVVRVDAVEELFDVAEILSKQALPAGPRLAVLTNAGGPAALASDALVQHGGTLAEFAPQTLAALDRLLPAHWSHSNPADMLGDADAARYEACLRTVLEDPHTDGALVILTPQAMTRATDTAGAVARAVRSTPKPVFASWMGGPAVAEGRALLDAACIPNFPYPDEAARAWQFLWEYRRRRHAAEEAVRTAKKTRPPLRGVREQIRGFLQNGPRILSELDSKNVLAAAGIPVWETHAAWSEEESVVLAKRSGFPVVLKLLSDTLTHKSDVGGVRLNLADEEAVRGAWRAIRGAVPEGDFGGVTVQRMCTVRGVELLAGCSIDPQFGPVLLFGAGGVLTEVFADRVLLLPPLSPDMVLERIARTRIFAALQGVRGLPPVPPQALAQLLVTLGDLALAVPEICELDMNPVLADVSGVRVLDARIRVEPVSAGGATGLVRNSIDFGAGGG
jgi:acetyltransferase